jgi:hypothetical protein
LVSEYSANLVGLRTVGLMKIREDVDDEFRMYALVPEHPDPFPRTAKRVRKGNAFGIEMDSTVTCTYSDYKKVICYDDRFSVILGPLEVVK